MGIAQHLPGNLAQHLQVLGPGGGVARRQQGGEILVARLAQAIQAHAFDGFGDDDAEHHLQLAFGGPAPAFRIRHGQAAQQQDLRDFQVLGGGDQVADLGLERLVVLRIAAHPTLVGPSRAISARRIVDPRPVMLSTDRSRTPGVAWARAGSRSIGPIS
ncbi:MAG: hypothetical protein NVV74_01230 [Magnetospirillum sp.]|nr:hypothetical protein [Magnetospirillum sp.]